MFGTSTYNTVNNTTIEGYISTHMATNTAHAPAWETARHANPPRIQHFEHLRAFPGPPHSIRLKNPRNLCLRCLCSKHPRKSASSAVNLRRLVLSSKYTSHISDLTAPWIYAPRSGKARRKRQSV